MNSYMGSHRDIKLDKGMREFKVNYENEERLNEMCSSEADSSCLGGS